MAYDDNDELIVERSNFNASRALRVVIHGWMSNTKGSFIRLIKDAYLQKGDFNVIVVDWSITASDALYYRVVKISKQVGEKIAHFLNILNRTHGVEFKNIYLIGHSLGAHIAGYVGRHVNPFKINTIFALDPSRTYFFDKTEEFKIESTDADYVESIQTDAFHFGLWESLGISTFYPNYGAFQNCFYYGCSHARSYEYFAESITSRNGFWGTPCSRTRIYFRRCSEGKEKVLMGGEPAIKKNGIFFVSTNIKSPYAKGKNG